MRQFILFAITTAFVGCTPQAAKMPIAPGAKFEIFAVTVADDPDGIETTDPASGGPLFLTSTPFITADDVATVSRSDVEVDSVSGTPHQEPALSVELTPAGAAKMSNTTDSLLGGRIAILVNGQVISTPTLDSQLQRSFVITGRRDAIESAFEALTKQ